MRIPFPIALAVLAATLSARPLAAADWYRWRGPDLNGISKETGWLAKWPAEGPKVLWKAAVGTGFGSFAVANNRAYTMGNADGQDTVFCFDATTGKELWKHSYACPLDAKYYEGGTHATPTVDGDRVYTVSKRGQIFCFDAAQGTVIWSKNLAEELGAKTPTWGFASSALIEGNALVVAVGGAGTALDKQTGKLIWTNGKEAAGYSTPEPFAARQGRAVAIFGAQAIVAVKVKDGQELWRFPWKTDYDINAAQPILDGDKVFISSGYKRGGALLKINANPPSVVWENKNMRNMFNSCVLIGGYLYGIDGNAGDAGTGLKCVDLQTGAVKWAENFGFGSLMAADGKLIVLTEKGELLVADASPEGFKPMARAQVLAGKCWTTPVLANGRLYCRNAKGDVVCLDVSAK